MSYACSSKKPDQAFTYFLLALLLTQTNRDLVRQRCSLRVCCEVKAGSGTCSCPEVLMLIAGANVVALSVPAEASTVSDTQLLA